MSESHTARLESALAGRYRIERKLGEGGMASVYLAEDVKHERKVALKILRPELAAVIGAERFLAEIKTTANLQHPHILPLFDSGEADGFLYYVMPYIEGESLREKLDRERQLGVDEAVRIAREVADALDYAHRNDIIHRDIKPANILLHDGRPVVADFGIALAISAAGGGRMTETGLSLGTPHYMSPEQASADRDLSARSDVYSLGCVLYEMLAGQPPHTGPSAQNILVRILTETPRPLTELRHTVPPHVAAVVTKAIEKLPADRFESARELIDALEDPSFTYVPAAPETRPTLSAPAAPATSGRAGGLPKWVTAATGVIALTVGYALAAMMAPEPAPEPGVEFALRADTSHVMISPCCGHAIAISPQGDRVVYVAAGSDRVVRLYQRPLGQRQASAIPGTEGGRYPFFSPDGEWLGFYDTRSGVTMRKVRFDGAAPLGVTTIPAPHRGSSWGDDGQIYFTHRGVKDLLKVSADGGVVTTVAVADTTVEYTLGWPDVLPGSTHALVSVMENTDGDVLRNAVHVVDLASGDRTPLIQNATDPRYVEPGYITFADGAGSIMAQEFDARTLELSGERFRIADRSIYRVEGQSEYDVSRTGTLVMLSGTDMALGTELVLVDREGSSEVLDVGREARLPRFSPDGRYLAFEVYSSSEPSDIWVWDLQRQVPTRVTFEGSNDHPSWSPDGASILFQRTAQGENHGYMKRRDGTGPATRVIDHVGRTPAFSPDGEWLIWATQPGGTTGAKIWVKEAENGEERELLGSGFPEFSPAISPDGRWLAYVAEDDGDDQVYVQSFPELGPRVKISVEGGREPRWSPDGRELFFRDYPSGSLVSVEVLPSEGVFEPGAFRELFPTMNVHARVASATNWDVHPDGERFVFVRTEGSGNTGTGPERLVITHALTRNR